jgi:endonuclease YncB( thermonuclease family)
MWDDVGAQAAMVDARRGKIVACLFQESAEVGWRWFRARIDGAAKSEAGVVLKSADGYDLWDVTYVDYGNRDRVTVQRMRPLEASLAAVAPQARECTLALIRVPPPTADWGTEAAGYVSDALLDRRVGFKVHGRDPATGVTSISLWDPESGACLNEELVAEGLARVSRTEALRVKRRGAAGADGDLLARVEAAQGVAKSKRAGLFQYGEPGDSEDDKRR